ncbi:uncharacterized protein VTP21DRAFT_7857 [Calcarisporiella thermophila]|uniref:uncharacterized protein n=1 Tax=Calcarisporiella thermophila TaxID=911321 RepID=UPI0037438C83
MQHYLARLAAVYAREEIFEAVQFLFIHHSSDILPYRFAILEQIPETSNPDSFAYLLPGIGPDNLEVQWWKDHKDPSMEPDWEGKSALMELLDQIKETFLEGEGERDMAVGIDCSIIPAISGVSTVPEIEFPASTEFMSQWYVERAHEIERWSGNVEYALRFVQLAISKGVHGLEHLSQDLNMLSHVVYDCCPTSRANLDLDFASFETLSPKEVIATLLCETTSDRIANDVRHFVMPYLRVLQSRWLQNNREHENPMSVLCNYLLDLAQDRLGDCCVILEELKTSSDDQLVLKDEVLMRLVLSCTYGSSATHSWPIMSRLFESIPHDLGSNKENHEEQNKKNEHIQRIDTKRIATPHDIYAQLEGWNILALRSAIDQLEVHLLSAEVMHRQRTAVPLRWFLESSRNHDMQKQLCLRMARRGVSEYATDEKWMRLLEDLLNLQDQGRGVLGELKIEEVYTEFLKALLGSGGFSLAREILFPTSGNKMRPLEPAVAEQLVIDTAREFFDNSTSGNMLNGNMKMAYDCLHVVPTTPAIRAELELIEATHTLTTDYKIFFKPGLAILPIQVRMSSNRLDLIARLLATNTGAYRQPTKILQITRKLGFQGDRMAEVRVIAMLADAALNEGDFETAKRLCTQLVELVWRTRKQSKRQLVGKKEKGEDLARIAEEATDITWRVCFEAAKLEEAPAAERTILAGHAISLCPKENMAELLQYWERLKALEAEEALKPKTPSSITSWAVDKLIGRPASSVPLAEMNEEGWWLSEENASTAIEGPSHAHVRKRDQIKHLVSSAGKWLWQ